MARLRTALLHCQQLGHSPERLGMGESGELIAPCRPPETPGGWLVDALRGKDGNHALVVGGSRGARWLDGWMVGVWTVAV